MIARLVLTPHRQVRAEFFDSLIQAQFNVMQNDGDGFYIYIQTCWVPDEVVDALVDSFGSRCGGTDPRVHNPSG